MKNIIITCGTSILNGKIIDNNDLKSKIDEIEEIEKEKDYKNIIEYYSNNDYKKLKSTKKITNYGAEINILKKVYENGDNIFLFFSETNGGKIVKDILKGYFKTNYAKKLYKDENFEIKDENFIEIEGFKVDDSNEFQEKAIPNFFKELEKIKNKFNIECNLTSFNDITKKTKIETIMCPVGGYKALIPYSSLYAMVNGWDIKYLYEDGKEIINLPSGALINLTGDLILNNDFNINIFKDINNLSRNYNYKDGIELSIGIRNFIEYGKSKELSNICDNFKKIFIKNKNYGEEKTCFEQLGKYLIILSDAFDLIRLNNVKESIESILILNTDTISDLLIKNSIIYLQKELKKININNFVKWYYERGRYAECILVMKEGMVDFIGKELKVDSKNRENRRKIEGSLKLIGGKLEKDPNYVYLTDNQYLILKSIFNGHEGFWNKMNDLRNFFAHINQDYDVNTMKKNIEEYYKEYQEITNNNLNIN